MTNKTSGDEMRTLESLKLSLGVLLFAAVLWVVGLISQSFKKGNNAEERRSCDALAGIYVSHFLTSCPSGASTLEKSFLEISAQLVERTVPPLICCNQSSDEGEKDKG
jgi:hypothetical protein